MLDNFSQDVLFENTYSDHSENLESHILSFQIKHSRICEWLIENRYSNYFALSLNNYLSKKGFLTSGQIDAVRKTIAKEEKQHANRSRRVNSTKSV